MCFAATCVFLSSYSNAGAGYTFYPLSWITKHGYNWYTIKLEDVLLLQKSYRLDNMNESYDDDTGNKKRRAWPSG